MKKLQPILIFLVLLIGMFIFPYLPMELFHFNIDNLPNNMKIIYNAGGILECSTIEISGNYIYADDIYVVNVDDIEIIEEG